MDGMIPPRDDDLEDDLEAAVIQLARCNPTPDAALSPLLQGTWALLYSGRSPRLAAASAAAFGLGNSGGSFGGAAAGALLPGMERLALQPLLGAAYRTVSRYAPVLAGSAVGRRRRGGGGGATNLQVVLPGGRIDNIVKVGGAMAPSGVGTGGYGGDGGDGGAARQDQRQRQQLRLCVSGSLEAVVS